MVWSWACPAVAIVFFVAWIASRSSVYTRLFADEHFLEVSRGVRQIKGAALDNLIASDRTEPNSPDDPRAVVTTAGLALLYTVRRVEGCFVHHYSVSVAEGYTAHAVGEMFVLFVAKLMGVPFASLALGVGRSTVHHAEFVLSSDEQIQLEQRPVLQVSLAEITAFRAEWLEARKHVEWQRL